MIVWVFDCSPLMDLGNWIWVRWLYKETLHVRISIRDLSNSIILFLKLKSTVLLGIKKADKLHDAV